MVRFQEPSEYDKLDEIVERVTAAHGWKLDVAGWTRKTYDVYFPSRDVGGMTHLARIESFATTSGEIRVFDDRALPWAQAVAEELERAFSIGEAVIIRTEE